MLRQEIRVDVVIGRTPVDLENEIVNALGELRANPDWEFEVQNVQYACTNIGAADLIMNQKFTDYSALIFYKMWPVVQVQQ